MIGLRLSALPCGDIGLVEAMTLEPHRDCHADPHVEQAAGGIVHAVERVRRSAHGLAPDPCCPEDLSDPFTGVAGDPDDLAWSDAIARGCCDGFGQIQAPLFERSVGPPVGARGGLQFAGHQPIVTQVRRPNQLAYRALVEYASSTANGLANTVGVRTGSMNTVARTSEQYRYLGVTDDCTECEKCGQVQLRSTVVLQPLDVDGNFDGDPVYFGSTCAARALAVKGGGHAVLQRARAGHHETLEAAADAIRMLALYGCAEKPHQDDATRATMAYEYWHRNATWAGSQTPADWWRRAVDFLARKRAAIAAAALVDPLCSACGFAHRPRSVDKAAQSQVDALFSGGQYE